MTSGSDIAVGNYASVNSVYLINILLLMQLKKFNRLDGKPQYI